MLQLTNQEKQEIVRYMEADKELPERYRFLLFEDKWTVEKNQVVFYDVAHIEDKPNVSNGKMGKLSALVVELTDFSIFYSQDSIAHAEEILDKTKRAGRRKIVVKVVDIFDNDSMTIVEVNV